MIVNGTVPVVPSGVVTLILMVWLAAAAAIVNVAVTVVSLTPTTLPAVTPVPVTFTAEAAVSPLPERVIGTVWL